MDNFYVKTSERQNLAAFFTSKDKTLTSCLEGKLGKAYAVPENYPKAALLILGDYCFFGGDAAAPEAQLLFNCIDEGKLKKGIVAVPSTPEWEKLIEAKWEGKFCRCLRYEMTAPESFDIPRLESFIEAIPERFSLRRIDKELYNKIIEEEWCCDGCANFPDADEYIRHGLGVCALEGESVVSSCSAYSYYSKGIDIEIDTRSDRRRMGLAAACAAKLILLCISMGLEPAWDAANLNSVALAGKLGYLHTGEYTAYEIKL